MVCLSLYDYLLGGCTSVNRRLYNSPTTRDFYAMIQNRFHYAITGQTAAEIVYSKVTYQRPHGVDHMEECSRWTCPKVRCLYRQELSARKEFRQLERAVTVFFDYIKDLIERENTFNMAQFSECVNEFLTFRRYQILPDKVKYLLNKPRRKRKLNMIFSIRHNVLTQTSIRR